MNRKKYIGNLIVANPCNPDNYYSKSVYLIAEYSENQTMIGICINRVLENSDLASIAQNLGIDYYRITDVYNGGINANNKISVIHSLDWFGPGTTRLNKEIGVTTDISVLMALSADEGPSYFKACAGYGIWQNGVFDLQMSVKKIETEPYKWEMIPATIENVFCIDTSLLWEHCLETSIITRVKDLF